MITVNDLKFKYPGQKDWVFDGFNLQMKENRVYGLLGKNGTGKSTLLYLISGLLRPAAGTVLFDETKTFCRNVDVLREMYLVPEEYELPSITLEKFVKLHSPFYPRFSRDILESCLNDFELTPDIHLGRLSMGQKKKVLMAFALATNTRLLLMDEPTNGLDIPSKSQFRKTVANNMSEERMIMISTHQVHDVESLLDHIIMLSRRELLLDASVQDIMDRYTFEYRQPVEMGDDVIYAEPTLQGNAVIAKRQDGAKHTQVNLELLFNAVTKGLLK